MRSSLLFFSLIIVMQLPAQVLTREDVKKYHIRSATVTTDYPTIGTRMTQVSRYDTCGNMVESISGNHTPNRKDYVRRTVMLYSDSGRIIATLNYLNDSLTDSASYAENTGGYLWRSYSGGVLTGSEQIGGDSLHSFNILISITPHDTIVNTLQHFNEYGPDGKRTKRISYEVYQWAHRTDTSDYEEMIFTDEFNYRVIEKNDYSDDGGYERHEDTLHHTTTTIYFNKKGKMNRTEIVMYDKDLNLLEEKTFDRKGKLINDYVANYDSAHIQTGSKSADRKGPTRICSKDYYSNGLLKTENCMVGNKEDYEVSYQYEYY